MDNFYSNALEFFVEHGIQLTEEQIYLLESKARALAIHKSNSNRNFGTMNREELDKLELGIRKVDLLNKKFNKGLISRKDYNKKFNNIRDKAGYLAPYIDKKGSKSLDKYLLPRNNNKYINPDKIKINNSSYKTNVAKIQHTEYKSDKNFANKIKRHNLQGLITDNPKETIDHNKRIQKIAGIYNNKDYHPDLFIKYNRNRKDSVSIQKSTPTKGVIFDKDKNFIHNSKFDNITKLSPTAKSQEGYMYGSQRIYGQVNSHDKNQIRKSNHSYKINNSDLKDNEKKIIFDPDYNGESIYIEPNKGRSIKTNKIE